MMTDAELVATVERRGLVSRGLTVAEIAARAGIAPEDCSRALQVLVAEKRATRSHPRGRGLKRQPTYRRGPPALDFLSRVEWAR